ncbi:hypothetical protein [Methanonatronarchaeum sp. AMET-Sl]|uniref:LeuA family protein n=1 Tax=Methanonatronarchaeum sp. AMET-Sl TaxID=3037654 RepID=UPI00244E0AA2|nr:hypothetical protein [Methanonatronarchaeum sp. AMET-Sl]WGI16937.1 hypothetical protein QEN48_05405 [Methanonatronarchaeum sp. AMET-Sl]
MITSYEDLPNIELPVDQEIKISDGTLREGAQMPGVVIKSEDKLQIYKYLHQIGVEKVENFLYSDRDRKVTREMIDLGYDKPEVTGWIRASKKDIELVTSMDGIEETGILTSVSDCHLFDKIGFESREEAKESYLEVVQGVVDHGITPRCHVEDVTRAEVEDFVLPFIEEIIEIDSDAVIRICDTLNYGIPFEGKLPYSIPQLVREIKDLGVKDIELHIHDDYGLGVANVLSGFWNGANWGNMTVMGLGERAGVAELEKVLLFLTDRLGIDKYDLTVLKDLANYLEENANYHVPYNKAVVGENVFAHESGIHTDGVIKNPFTYEPYPPEMVGAKRKFMIGDSSGREVIAKKTNDILKEQNIELKVDKNDKRIKEIYNDIQQLYEENKRSSCILDKEFKEIMNRHFDKEV